MPDPHTTLFKALSSRSRTRLLHLLAQNEELSVDELTKLVKLAGPTVSRHLQVLRMLDLVSVRVDAQNRFYSLNKDQLLSRLNAFLKHVGIQTAAQSEIQ
jgi:ArsR family transcriptional regulator